MKQEQFIKSRSAFWNEMEQYTQANNKALVKNAADFPAKCRRLTTDINTARACGMDSQLIERLNRLTVDSWRLLRVSRPVGPADIARFLVKDFPTALRREWKSFLVANLLFWIPCLLFCFIVIQWPEISSEFVSLSQLETLEEMYDPASEYYLTPRSVTNDADMFGYYIYNNISIAFRTFAGGVLAGIGSLFLLIFNAIFMGVATGHLINMSYSETFFSFIIAHSSFELIAIVISAQAGLLMGWSLFARKGLSVRASIQEAGRRALPLIGGAACMLVMAAAIEAFWSSRHELPTAIRLGAGVVSWIILIAWLGFSGREANR